MVSIYSLSPVYTFLYIIMNGNVIASFVQKKKSFEILWFKKKIFACARVQLWNPLPPCTQSDAFGLTTPLPFVRTYYPDDPVVLEMYFLLKFQQNNFNMKIKK